LAGALTPGWTPFAQAGAKNPLVEERNERADLYGMARNKQERGKYVAPQLQEVEWEVPPPIELRTRGDEIDEISREIYGLPLPAQLALVRALAPPLLKGADSGTRKAILDMISPEAPDLH
jgi:hypothetical protein